MSTFLAVLIGATPLWVMIYIIFFTLGPWKLLYAHFPAALPFTEEGTLLQATLGMFAPRQWALVLKVVWIRADDKGLSMRLLVRPRHCPLTIPWNQLLVRGIYKRYIKGMGEDIAVVVLPKLPKVTLFLEKDCIQRAFPTSLTEKIDFAGPFPPLEPIAPAPKMILLLVAVVLFAGPCLFVSPLHALH